MGVWVAVAVPTVSRCTGWARSTGFEGSGIASSGVDVASGAGVFISVYGTILFRFSSDLHPDIDSSGRMGNLTARDNLYRSRELADALSVQAGRSPFLNRSFHTMSPRFHPMVRYAFFLATFIGGALLFAQPGLAQIPKTEPKSEPNGLWPFSRA